jgi:Sulfotransferase domain
MSKIFIIGTQRTGTTSLGDALALLGHKVTGHMVQGFRDDLIQLQRHRSYELLYDYVRRSDCTVFREAPWSTLPFCLTLYEEFPGSQFILTLRDEQSWLPSHQAWLGPLNMSGFYEVCDQPRYNPRHALWEKRIHEAMILQHFGGRNNLLVMNICDKHDGWDVLCPFLGISVPPIPFPATNRAKGYARWRRQPVAVGRTSVDVCVVAGSADVANLSAFDSQLAAFRLAVQPSIDCMARWYVVTGPADNQSSWDLLAAACRARGYLCRAAVGSAAANLEDKVAEVTTADYVLRLDAQDQFLGALDPANDIQFMETNADVLLVSYVSVRGLPGELTSSSVMECGKTGTCYQPHAQLRHRKRFQATFPNFATEYLVDPAAVVTDVIRTTPWRVTQRIRPVCTC